MFANLLTNLVIVALCCVVCRTLL